MKLLYQINSDNHLFHFTPPPPLTFQPIKIPLYHISTQPTIQQLINKYTLFTAVLNPIFLMIAHSLETTTTTTNNNNNLSNSMKIEENCSSSTTSEQQNFSIDQKSFFLSSPLTQPLDGSLKRNDLCIEPENLLSNSLPFKRVKKDSLSLDETETKNTQNASEDLLTMENEDIQKENSQIEEEDDHSTKKSTHKKAILKNYLSTENNLNGMNKSKKSKSRKQNDSSYLSNVNVEEEDESNEQQAAQKKKKIRKACRFNYIEHYINHHQLSHRIETDEIIFENESFIPSNYQTYQYFNGNPISFFTLVNIHKRVQKVEHILNNNNKKKGTANNAQSQPEGKNAQNSKINNNNSTSLNNKGAEVVRSQQQLQQHNPQSSSLGLNSQIVSINHSNNNINSLNNQQNKSSKSISSKKQIANQKQSLATANNNNNNNNPNQLHKKKDYVNIVFEDRTHFQKSSLNQFIKKIKSLPGKGASLYSEAIEDFIQNKITLQKTVSYNLLDNFIDGLGNFYLLRVFKQTTTDLIIDHYTLSSSLIRLLGFETSTFCSFVVSHGVPYIHDVSGNYLEYIARCMKSWVRSSENTTLDATLICADSLRIECTENIYTRTFHNADKQEYYLVETHVFRPKKSDSKDYMLSDERIRLFQQSFEPFTKPKSEELINQDQKKSQQSSNKNESPSSDFQEQTGCSQSKIEYNASQETIQQSGDNLVDEKCKSADDFISSIIINITQNNEKNDNSNSSGKKQTLKRKAVELPHLSNNKIESAISEQNIEKKLCKYRFI